MLLLQLRNSVDALCEAVHSELTRLRVNPSEKIIYLLTSSSK